MDAAALDAPDIIAKPNPLAFAGLPQTSVRVIPVAYHLAEKLHAYTRIYSGGTQSTRVKDLVDIVLMARHHVVELEQLSKAIHEVFSMRGTHDVPELFTRPPIEWERPFANLALPIGLSPNVVEAASLAQKLFEPVLRRNIEKRIWNPGNRDWTNPTQLNRKIDSPQVRFRR